MSAGVVASNSYRRDSRIDDEEIRMKGGLMGMGREEIHGRTARIKDKVKVMGKDNRDPKVIIRVRVRALDLG
jgi:hypothetical protein